MEFKIGHLFSHQKVILFFSNFSYLCLYVGDNCIEKSKKKISIAGLKRNYLIKYHYCVIENATANMFNVIKMLYGN